MVTSDTKSSPASLSPTLDSPPSYAFAVTEPTASSSSAPVLTPAPPPKDTLHLFSGPPNAEPLLARSATPEEVLAHIETKRKGQLVTSADPKLQHGGVLYDWLRRQALTPPTVKIKCEGVHFETPERDEIVQDRDGSRHRRKGQPERIVDFDFTIDLTSIFAHPDNLANVHISTVSPDVPASRGTHHATYSAVYSPAPAAAEGGYSALQGVTDAGRPAARDDLAIRTEWVAWRAIRGLPPWVRMEDWKEFWDSRGKGKGAAVGALSLSDGPAEEESLVGNSEDVERARTHTALRAWCDKYAADQGLLKEFVVPLWFWGWDVEGLTTAIKGAITSTGYNSNHLTVTVVPETIAYVVRPRNILSRAVNSPFVYALLWLTLLYPIIWVWQRVHRLGGAPYNVSRITYGMKYYPPLPSTFVGETVDQAAERLPGMYKIHSELPKPATLVYGPKGVHYLLGRKEGEWFREWEERIRMGVRMRYKGELMGGGEEEAGRGLDGY